MSIEDYYSEGVYLLVDHISVERLPMTRGAPKDALRSGRRAYKRDNIAVTWESARAFCEARGGHLVTITSAAEQSAVTSSVEPSTNVAWTRNR